tara:strand:+ start:1128 stop:1871 length:744 start_codon:yes stop_codon:yes gene_type:complete
MSWALDLDGVVWLGNEIIPGVPNAISRIRRSGERVFFVTNASAKPVSQVEKKLLSFGIEPDGGVITSAMAVVLLLEHGERVLPLCGDGAIEEMKKAGVQIVQDGHIDSVVVGLDEDFNYWKLAAALKAIDSGARLVATNDDLIYPAHDGIRPGAGSILAPLVAATGVTPEVAGKPHQPMCDLLSGNADENGIMVGDRPDTDGLFAKNMGWDFALVLSGVTNESDLPVEPPHDLLAEHLPDLVEKVIG